jgi:anti-sigma regulatory factor (Ser/Thr protein kinase)
MALNQAFDAGTLHVLRKAVLAEAAAAGMPDDRATEVMLAVHELAANAVCHGGGAGRARMRAVAGDLRCQVSDAGPGGANGAARKGGAGAIRPWPLQPGHGLWLVRNAADRLSVASGPDGSEVTAVFILPGSGGAAAGHQARGRPDWPGPGFGPEGGLSAWP